MILIIETSRINRISVLIILCSWISGITLKADNIKMQTVNLISNLFAFWTDSTALLFFLFGKFLEYFKNKAMNINSIERKRYNILIFSILGSVFIIPPNSIKLNKIGPIVVPNELIPPAKFNRWEPVSGLPSDMVKGFADVCCRQNPIAKINNDSSIKLKDPVLIAGIINVDPITDINRP